MNMLRLALALGTLVLPLAPRTLPAQEMPAAPSGDRVLRADGRPTDPDCFPIAVWLQSPRNATRYREAGINLYVGLWRGPTEEQLGQLRAAGMPVICDQNEVGLAHRDDPLIAGWMHGDEPDNAQPVRDPDSATRRWGPPVPPATVVADYERLRSRDATRPVLLNLGQGVANDAWIGRGPGASPDDYPRYVQGADIVSFDVYPVAGLSSPDRLWLVPLGLERLTAWTGGRKVLWSCVECTRISNLDMRPTPAQVEAEVWMAIARGSRGLIWFVHQFRPEFDEDALLADSEMLATVSSINHRLQRLARVLNTEPEPTLASVSPADPAVPFALRAHRADGAVWLIAANLRNCETRAHLALDGTRGARSVEVVDEDRRIAVEDDGFDDAFGPFATHVYRIATTRGQGLR
ncbi:MAG: hypothetical protein IPM29_25665 [Planctomycetes bacterium]|nr:hypothetical protein [Planctomycetota bacterium]